MIEVSSPGLNVMSAKLRVVYHEAAHWIACEKLGIPVSEIIIAPNHGQVIHASKDPITLVAVIAGPVGESIIFGDGNSQTDMEQLNEYLDQDGMNKLAATASELLTKHFDEWVAMAHQLWRQTYGR